jgi:hypothetical protein
MTFARHVVPAIAFAVCGVGGLIAWTQRIEPSRPVDSTPPVRAITLPTSFEENHGQFDPAARFVARTDGGVVFVARGEIVFAGGPRPIRMRVDGANADAPTDGVDELPGKANYFFGNDPANWRTDVPTFARTRTRGVLPGVDLVGRLDGRRFEYDLVVGPGVDPSTIAVTFDGAERLDVDAAGDLVAHVGDWEMRQRKPVVYQEIDGARRAVDCAWIVDGADRAAFRVAGYDATRTLCIDPAVIYASYLGGSATEYGRALTRDVGGNFFLAGRTTSTNFPLSNAYQGAYGGAGPQALGDAFVAKIDPTGATLLFSTYLGGNGDEEARGIAVDTTGVYVGGRTDSTLPQFPTTLGVIQATQGLGADMFVAKLTPAGNALLFSTLLDGGPNDECNALTIDGSGNVYVAGQAGPTMTTTAGAIQTTYGGGASDAWVAKLNATGSAFVYATYLGGGAADVATGVALDGSNAAYVCGYTASTNFPTAGTAAQTAYGGGTSDAFVASVNVGGVLLVYSTYLGGTGRDQANAIAAASFGNATVVGYTDSTNFPTNGAGWPQYQGGLSDAFAASFLANGQTTYITYFGGSGGDEALGIWMDDTTAPWITGVTSSPTLPTPSASTSPRATLSGTTDAFLVHLAAGGSTPLFDTFLGGGADDAGYAVTVGVLGDAYVLGRTTSSNVGATLVAVQTTYGGSGDALFATQPASGGGGGGGGGGGTTTPIDAFFLPKSVVAKANAKQPAKSSLVVSGSFDTGSKTLDPTAAATLDVGGLHVDIPQLTRSANGKQYRYAAAGLTFTVVPAPTGSSRATFTLKRTGDFTGLVPVDGNVAMRFANSAIDGTGEVILSRGRYALGKVRGALVKPNLYVAAAKAVVKGGGKDALTLVVGLATNGQTPTAASDVTVKFGGSFTRTIPAAKFAGKGSRFVFKGDPSVPGITNVTLDYARETITLTGKALDLGSFVAGANPAEIDVSLGTDSRAVVVRAVLKKTTLSY